MFVCKEREGERRMAAWLRAMCVPCWLRGAARVCVCVGRCVLCVSDAYLLLGGVQRLCEVVVRLIDRAGGHFVCVAHGRHAEPRRGREDLAETLAVGRPTQDR